jgi:hypothetical protein
MAPEDILAFPGNFSVMHSAPETAAPNNSQKTQADDSKPNQAVR